MSVIMPDLKTQHLSRLYFIKRTNNQFIPLLHDAIQIAEKKKQEKKK